MELVQDNRVSVLKKEDLKLIKKVSKAPDKALSDFHIFKLIAHYWGCSDILKKWEKPEDVFQSLKKLSIDRPSDISGIINYKHLEKKGGIQWPYPKNNADSNKERRLFEDGKYYHSDQKARFIFEKPRVHPDKVSKMYPFILLTGRGSSAQWHTETRTGKSLTLKKLHSSDCHLEISPEDAKKLCLQTRDTIWIESPRGKIKAKALVSASMQVGHVFFPMHSKLCNSLTFSAFDPYSGQPAFKTCAVNIRALLR
jgi:assimilatory nitrate reductase catalytic subunit